MLLYFQGLLVELHILENFEKNTVVERIIQENLTKLSSTNNHSKEGNLKDF
jgi:hypothetical protein